METLEYEGASTTIKLCSHILRNTSRPKYTSKCCVCMCIYIYSYLYMYIKMYLCSWAFCSGGPWSTCNYQNHLVKVCRYCCEPTNIMGCCICRLLQVRIIKRPCSLLLYLQTRSSDEGGRISVRWKTGCECLCPRKQAELPRAPSTYSLVLFQRFWKEMPVLVVRNQITYTRLTKAGDRKLSSECLTGFRASGRVSTVGPHYNYQD